MLSSQYQLCDSLPKITLMAHNGKLIALDWSTQKTQKLLDQMTAQAISLGQDLDDMTPSSQSYQQNAAVLLATKHQLAEYIQGVRQTFEVPLDLSAGTPFQQKVWQALCDIPYGTTISYAELARRIGQPTAFRAVANANGKNPISLIVPCHRVVASDGGLGGYTGGVAIKHQLLQLERQGRT